MRYHKGFGRKKALMDQQQATISPTIDGILAHNRAFVERRELGVEDIMIVAHTNCGAQHMSGKEMVANMERLGVSAERIEFARHCGIDFDKWLAGFGDTEEAVRKSVDMVANHPVMPPHVRVIGFIMDSDTGELIQVEC